MHGGEGRDALQLHWSIIFTRSNLNITSSQCGDWRPRRLILKLQEDKIALSFEIAVLKDRIGEAVTVPSLPGKVAEVASSPEQQLNDETSVQMSSRENMLVKLYWDEANLTA